MQHSIKSKTFNVASSKGVLTFTCQHEYIFVDLNGRAGTLGNQLCMKGKLTGSTLRIKPDDYKEFKQTCNNWYRSYKRQSSL